MSKRPKRKAAEGDVATNRRASHRYELVERFEAGIELRGSEVKSLREGKTQIGDAYAAIDGGEIWLRNAHIPPYGPASIENHEPERPRKLLLHRYELNETETALVGERHGRVIRLGDPVRVRVGKVEAARGRTDLRPAGEGR